MTPERRKYIESISKEEQYLREVIIFAKFVIKDNKDSINDGIIWDEQVGKKNIAKYKAVIKSLKKQLPAPRRYWSSFRLACNCPICNNQVIKKDDYCPKCGQKLR